MKYFAHYEASENDPIEGGISSVWRFLDVDIGDKLTDAQLDMNAYLLATNRSGQLKSLSRWSPSGTTPVWKSGMPAPGSRITTDMVGLTFDEAIALSFYK